MDLKETLGQYAQMTQAGLEQYLPQGAPGLDILFESARYSALSGGKRLRPALLMEFYRLCGGQPQDALPFACALEMIHTYSMIHDDLPCMDNDDLRRGKPTNHKAYGEALALLAGDGLLTRSFETMLGHVAPGIEPANALAAAHTIAACAGMEGMIGGQVLDLAFEGQSPSGQDLERMVDLKTGQLLLAACAGGCQLAGERGALLVAATAYAKALGLAFQIQDDILDVLGDTEALGKKTGSDAQNQKSTFVTCYGLERCQQMVRQLTEQAVQALEGLPGTGLLQQLARQLAARNH